VKNIGIETFDVILDEKQILEFFAIFEDGFGQRFVQKSAVNYFDGLEFVRVFEGVDELFARELLVLEGYRCDGGLGENVPGDVQRSLGTVALGFVLFAG
jgi:hypothetical protein